MSANLTTGMTGASTVFRVTPAPLLVVASIAGIQAGQSWATLLFGSVGPLGVVTLRLGFAALILLALLRPHLPTGRRAWTLVITYGGAIAGMNVFIYPALQYLPIGVAVTFQFLGPFVVALAGSRRWLDGLWALLAGLGVFLFTQPTSGHGPISLVGVGFALASGASWVLYIIANKRAGAASAGADTLALAVTVAALIALPVGLVDEHPSGFVHPATVLTGLGIAALSAVVPYLLDLLALRRLPTRLFGILGSLEPAVGGFAGVLIAGEHLAAHQIQAIGCVVAASVGASLSSVSRTTPSSTENPHATTEHP
jgi:inner membrane transporter RhtA